MNNIPFEVWLTELEKHRRTPKKITVDILNEEQIKFIRFCREGEEEGRRVISFAKMEELFNERYGTQWCKETIRNLWLDIKKYNL